MTQDSEVSLTEEDLNLEESSNLDMGISHMKDQRVICYENKRGADRTRKDEKGNDSDDGDIEKECEDIFFAMRHIGACKVCE